MTEYVQVIDQNTEEEIELPTESDNTLLLSTLTAQFPNACGLRYKSSESATWRGVRVEDGKLHPPRSEGMWGSVQYSAVYPKEPSKKDYDENWALKSRRGDGLSKTSDLIVLGLPWKTTEEELKSHFKNFGDIVMAQVKKDPKTGQSKGFGFIRFAELEAQAKVLAQRHMIEGRWCDVKLPNSRDNSGMPVSRNKIFVGRVTENITAEDLRNYFSKFGDILDVFIPKPFRGFAFVTFVESDIAINLAGEDHIISGTSVHVSSAAPKGFRADPHSKAPMAVGGPPPLPPLPWIGNPRNGDAAAAAAAASNMMMNPALMAAALSQWGMFTGLGHPPPHTAQGGSHHQPHQGEGPGGHGDHVGSGWGQSHTHDNGTHGGWGVQHSHTHHNKPGW